jgi:hypothetical protein
LIKRIFIISSFIPRDTGRSLLVCRWDIVAGKAAFIPVPVAIDIGPPGFLSERGLTAFPRTARKAATGPSDFRKRKGG